MSRAPADPPDSEIYTAPPTLMAVLLLPLTTAVRRTLRRAHRLPLASPRTAPRLPNAAPPALMAVLLLPLTTAVRRTLRSAHRLPLASRQLWHITYDKGELESAARRRREAVLRRLARAPPLAS